MLVDEDSGTDLDAGLHDAAPVGGPQPRNLRLTRPRQARQLRRGAHELPYGIDQKFMLARTYCAGISLERYLQQRGAGTRKPEDENGGRHRSRLAPGGRLCAPLLGTHALELLRERQGVLERTLAARIALGVVLPQRLIAARVGGEGFRRTAGGIEHIAEEPVRVGAVHGLELGASEQRLQPRFSPIRGSLAEL